ncbi:type II toxin-antitoxin system PemK/MazF family toxin [Micromonospora sp. WMMD812]|uniref:type II toxin-antitoxin system PemK/MazF family toxin n=1 Tax=Micromonospora sp. WMMD812 TaxID=3015152 RepID=UPI00248C8A5C|nr:type II toxin-antitoxin system PemK/MazF family toxin [Micromonospora sp. WMMD812]WBB70540.1 type II toxin-antitoxin system PemK/MazF family toxin [Micromonospora sp. WMMD812]
MPEWMLWAAAVLLAFAAGWLWQDRRQRGDDEDRRQRTGRRGGDEERPAGRGPDAGRAGAPPRPRTDGRAAAGPPRPGEIWWADVPYADGSGSKVRPCLVLRADGRSADVLKITSQDKSDRDDHVRIPTRDWDPDADHDSYLDLSDPIPVPRTAFRDHAGDCDPTLWRRLESLPHLST